MPSETTHPQTNTDQPDLSVIVPVCDEAGSISTFLEELLSVVGPAVNAEVLVVDDGSRDGSEAIVEALLPQHANLRLIRHGKRAGKSAALKTGAERARGLWLGTIDGDGENDPRDLLNMVGEIDLQSIGSLGLVAGIRRRRTAGASRLIASRIANGIRKAALRDDCPDTACGLKVIPRELFLRLPFRQPAPLSPGVGSGLWI